MEIDIVKIISIAGDLSAFSLLAVAIVGGFKGWYVWRWTYDKHIALLEIQVNEWKTIARQGLKITDAVIKTGGNP